MGLEYSAGLWANNGTWLEYNNYTVVNHATADSYGSTIPPRVGGFQRGGGVGYCSEAYFRFNPADIYDDPAIRWGAGWTVQNVRLNIQWGTSNIAGITKTLKAFLQNRRNHDQWNQPPWGARAPQFDDFPPIDSIWSNLIGSVSTPIGAANSYSMNLIPASPNFLQDWYDEVDSPMDGIVLTMDTAYYNYFAEIKRLGITWEVYSPDVSVGTDRQYRNSRM